MTTRVRRALSLVGAGALTAGLTVALPAGAAHAATDPAPAAAGAAWLAAQPVDGLITLDSGFGPFTDHGLSIDVALALDTAGGHDETVTTIRDAVAAQVDSYLEYDIQPVPESGPTRHLTAGSVAKAAVLAQETGGDATAFGGRDLIALLEERTVDAGARAGRIEDVFNPTNGGDFPDADYANVVGQAFAVRALDAAGSGEAAAATNFLLQQQCDNGGFRLYLSKPADADQGCSSDATANPDATARALDALHALGSSDPAVDQALADGSDYLLGIQRPDGSFGGGTSTEGANANSTGLAGIALADLGETEAAGEAALWLRTHQVAETAGPCANPLLAHNGAVAYDDVALADGRTYGIQEADRSQWIRAAAEALPLLRLAGADDPAAAPTLTACGPTRYLQGKSTVTVTVGNLAEGVQAVASGPGTQRTVTGTGAPVTLRVTLPAKTGTARYTVAAAEQNATVMLAVLGKAKLKVIAKKAKVAKRAKQKLVVKGLAAREKVKISFGSKRIVKGKANAKGTFKTAVAAPKRSGKVKVKAVGQFRNRTGTTTFRVR